MGFSLYSLLEATLLVINALAILNEQRFLSKLRWNQDTTPYQGFGPSSQGSVKTQALHLIRSVQTVMRIPLIFLNSIVIIVKLLLG